MDYTAQQKADLDHYGALLRKWQKTINLVAPSTLAHWPERHFRDSAQLLELAPEAKTWVDLGSGGGFPGLVVAVLMRHQPLQVHLVESDARKAAFLRTVSREIGASAIVHHARVEAILPTMDTPDVVSARALAPLHLLLEWTAEKIDRGARGLFLKGQDVDAELKQVSSYSRFSFQKYPSQTDPQASVIEVRRA